MTLPRQVAVVGAGIVGLCTTWFLQEQDVDVTVLERGDVGAGSSWGNAGWIAPSIATPLPEPAVIRYGLKALFSSTSPLYVPLRPDFSLLRFVAGFARNSTPRRWAEAMRAMIPINQVSLESYDLLASGGADGETHEAQPLLAAFETTRQRDEFVSEIQRIKSAGQGVTFGLLNGRDVQAAEPLLSERIRAAVQVHGQRYVDPAAYLRALATSIRQRGGAVHSGVGVAEVLDTGQAVRLSCGDGTGKEYDAVVLATGAWLGDHARRFGVRTVVQSGRGYSFSVATACAPSGPLYFPAARVACTPVGGRLRIAGTMEFRPPADPPDPHRITAMAQSVTGLFRGVDLGERSDEWAGARPCSPDGLPLIGATISPRVFVAGGHGMWGVTLGPATGRLLARRVATGIDVPELAPFDPLR